MVLYWKAIGPNRYKVNSLINFGGRYIYLDDENSSKYSLVQKENVKRLERTSVILLVLITSAYFLYGLVPLYAFCFQNIRATPIATRLPYFDPQSNVGFAMNLLQQGIMVTYGMVGNFCIQTGVVLLINAIMAVPELLRVDLNELAKEVQLHGMSSRARNQLRHILMKIQDFDG